MADYIQRTDVMKICEGYSEHCFHSNDSRGQDIADRILDDVVEIPSADVVEVVRCKDCANAYFVGSCSKYECRMGCGKLKYSNDFCSYGQKK